MKTYVYILKCSDDSYYIGSTQNLKRRLQEHQSGNGAVHTIKRLPVELVYYERCTSKDKAIIREQELKGWNRNKKESLITSSGWSSNFAIGVYAVIKNLDEEILLMKHSDRGFWMLPGGGMEPGEKILYALKREIKEEIGIEIHNIKLEFINEKSEKNKIILIFSALYTNKIKFSPTNEASEINFFHLKNLPKNIAPSSLERIETLKNSKSLNIVS